MLPYWNSEGRVGIVLTVGQSIKPVLHPLYLDAVFYGLQFFLLLTACSLVIVHNQSCMIHSSGICGFEIVAKSYNNSSYTSLITIIANLYMLVNLG